MELSGNHSTQKHKINALKISDTNSSFPNFKAPQIFTQRYADLVKSVFDESSPLFIESLLDIITALGYSTAPKSVRDDKFFKIFVNKFSDKITQLFSRVSLSDFDVIRKLGSGAFGAVFLVKEKYSGSYYAMKKVNKFTMDLSDPTLFASFFTEKEIMINAKSHWIPCLYYAFQDAKNLYYTMEFLPGGTLDDLIDENYPLNPSVLAIYSAQCVLGIHAVHQLGYIHRDIKTENFLITSQGLVKIGDFGLALKLDDNKRWSTMKHAGTTEYMSLELIESMEYNHCRDFGLETDWWSLGILIHVLRAGFSPYVSITGVSGTNAIKRHNVSTMVFETDSDGLPFQELEINIIRKLLAPEDERAFFPDIIAHPIFKDIDFSNLHKQPCPWIPGVSSDIYTENKIDIMNFDNSKYYMADKFQGEHIPFSGFTQIRGMFNNNELMKLQKSKTLSSSSLPKSSDNTKKIQDLESRIKNLKESNHSLAKDIDALKNKNESLNEQLRTSQKLSNELSEKISQQKIKKQNLKLDKIQLEHEKEELLESLERVMNEKQLYDKEKQNNESTIIKIRSDLSETEQKYDCLVKEMKDLQYRLSESEIKLKQADKQRESLDSGESQISTENEARHLDVIQNLKNELEVKQSQLCKKDEEIESLEEELKRLKTELFDLNNKRELLDSKIQVLDINMEQKVDESKILNEKLQKTNGLLLKANQDFANMKQEKNLINSKLQQLITEHEAIEFQLQNKDEAVKKLEEKYRTNKTKLKQTTNDLENSKLKLNDAMKKFKNKEEKYTIEIHEKDAKIVELQDLKRQNENTISILQTQNSQFKKLSENLSKNITLQTNKDRNRFFSHRNAANNKRDPELKKLKDIIDVKNRELMNIKKENIELRDTMADKIDKKNETINELLNKIYILETNLKNNYPILEEKQFVANDQHETSNVENQTKSSDKVNAIVNDDATFQKFLTTIVSYIKENSKVFDSSSHSYADFDSCIFEVMVLTPPKSNHFSSNTANYNKATISLMLKDKILVLSIPGIHTLQCHFKSACLADAFDNKKIVKKFGRQAMKLFMGINSFLGPVKPSKITVKMYSRMSNHDDSKKSHYQSGKTPIKDSKRNSSYNQSSSSNFQSSDSKHNFGLSNVKNNLEECSICKKLFASENAKIPVMRCSKCNLVIHNTHKDSINSLGPCKPMLYSTLVIFHDPDVAQAWNSLLKKIVHTPL